MEYLLKVSAVVAIFYFSYKLFLQRDTFFEQNRWFLLLGLVTAFVSPLFVITEYIEYSPITMTNYVVDDTVAQNTQSGFDVLDYLPMVYFLGLIFFLGRFLIQIASLLTLIFKANGTRKGVYTFIETQADASPFSFFNWIVYNPNQFNKTELEQIITHEKVHVQQYHSVDVLLTQIACILLWFNPFIWLYNKDLKQNLEFLADHAAINFSNCKKAYQYTLLKTSLPTHQLALSNHFYNSLIKKRIVMLHKSKSKKINLFKFIFVVPILAIFLMSFNVKKVYVEKKIPKPDTPVVSYFPMNDAETLTKENAEKISEIETKQKPKTSNKPLTTTVVNTNTKPIAKIGDTQMVLITKNFTDADFEHVKAQLKKEGIDVKFKGIKRNDKGKITAIKIEVSSKQANANYSINSDEGIEPIKISYNSDGGKISIGNSGLKSKAVSYVYANTNGKNKVKTLKKENNVMVLSPDNNEKFEIVLDNDDDVEFIVVSDVDVDLDEEHQKDVDIKIIKSKGKGAKIKKLKGAKVYEIKDSDEAEEIVIHNDGGEAPLYVINGKEVDNLQNITPKDIKNMKVLKGESAKNKYGDKGKNGVIEITTIK